MAFVVVAHANEVSLRDGRRKPATILRRNSVDSTLQTAQQPQRTPVQHKKFIPASQYDAFQEKNYRKRSTAALEWNAAHDFAFLNIKYAQVVEIGEKDLVGIQDLRIHDKVGWQRRRCSGRLADWREIQGWVLPDSGDRKLYQLSRLLNKKVHVQLLQLCTGLWIICMKQNLINHSFGTRDNC